MKPGNDDAFAAPVKEVKDEAGTKGLEVTFRVPVPPDALLAILWDTSHFGRLYPDILEVRRVAGNDGDDSFDLAYRVNAVIKEVAYVLRRSIDREARLISWREVSGDLRRVRGAWRVTPALDGSSSELTYSAFVDVGRFIPTALVRDAAIRKLGEMMARVRKVTTELHAQAAGAGAHEATS